MKIFKYFIEAIFIYVLFFLFRILGIDLSRKFSSFFLVRFGLLFRKKEIIKNNILKVFKKYSDTDIDKLIKKMWSNYGLTFAEYVFLDKFRFNKLPKSHIEISGEEILVKVKKVCKP